MTGVSGYKKGIKNGDRNTMFFRELDFEDNTG